MASATEEPNFSFHFILVHLKFKEPPWRLCWTTQTAPTSERKAFTFAATEVPQEQGFGDFFSLLQLSFWKRIGGNKYLSNERMDDWICECLLQAGQKTATQSNFSGRRQGACGGSQRRGSFHTAAQKVIGIRTSKSRLPPTPLFPPTPPSCSLTRF